MTESASPLETVADVLTANARVRPEAAAILALDGAPMTYAALAGQAARTRQALRSFGVGPADRVAIILPDGVDAAVMFLSVSACAVAAPLNPTYRAAEFAFHLDDLAVRAIVVQAGSRGGVVDLAQARGISVIEMTPLEGRTGCFALSCDRQVQSAWDDAVPVEPDAPALLLHTSGTTARPKLVALSHANLCAAARQNNVVVDLGPDDRALSVMPLFHVGGLIRSLFSPLYAGGSVVRTSGFQATRFLEWLRDYKPTWYAAGPTTQRAILDVARQYGSLPIRSSLRFILSGAAPMNAKLQDELERAFDVPVIARYGMTETAGQITSNPLPPGIRKRGSVGIAAGLDVAVMDDAGRMLADGQAGEIVVRGPNVIRAYEHNATINAAAFVNGWFRTGDQGYRDEDGYYFITGRLKEVINRGGEKIAPREVDEVLLDHPSVAQAVAFAMPDPRLDEVVAAAVVVRPGTTLDERQLQAFVASRLAFFKVPARIVFLDELPKGPTGKIQRIGLAARLGLPGRLSPTVDALPRMSASATARVLIGIWAELLNVRTVGPDDDFFDLGGHSMHAIQLMSRIETVFGRRLPLATLFEARTVRELADIVDERKAQSDWISLVPVQTRGSKPPFFCVHGVGGEVLRFSALAARLAPDQPFIAFRAPGYTGVTKPLHSIEEQAALYVREMIAFQRVGPYYIGGYSHGGRVALEMALQLEAMGRTVAFLGIIDAAPSRIKAGRVARAIGWLRNLPLWLWYDGCESSIRANLDRLRRVWRRTTVDRAAPVLDNVMNLDRLPAVFQELYRTDFEASLRYQPGRRCGDVTLFRSIGRPLMGNHESDLGWGRVSNGTVEVRRIAGNHSSMLSEPYVDQLATELRETLENAQARAAAPLGIGPRHSEDITLDPDPDPVTRPELSTA